MKIAQVVCRFKPYKGGISNVAYDHALGLSELGHDVTVFTPLYGRKDESFTSDKYKIKRLVSFGRLGNGAFLPQLFWQLRKFDLVHLHYPFYGGAEIVWLLKLLKGNKIKLVVEYHMDVIGGGAMKPFFKFHTKFIMPQIIKVADKVVFSSDDYASHSNIKDLIKKNPEKFKAIPPSVDLKRFFPNKKDHELLYKYSIHPENDKVLVFVGALDKAHYFKGIQFLIDSFNVLDYSGCNDDCGYRLKLIVVGGGDLKEKYQKQVEAAGLAKKIFFAGKVSDKDLPKYYNIADLVILPSIDKSEAFGITLIEAMACAKPVVAANLPGVRSVFDDGQSGYSFAVLQEGDLANRVNKLFMDDELRLKMGQAAQEKAEQMYNHDILIKKLETLYTGILKN